MRNLPIAGIVAILLCVSALSTAAFADDTKAIGATGGGLFHDACRPGDALVGIRYYAGKDLDRAAGVCAVVRDGKPVWQEHYEFAYRGAGDSESYADDLAGADTCPDGMVIQNLEVAMSDFHQMHAFAFTCANMSTGERSRRFASNTHGGLGNLPMGVDCGNGAYASGLLGRSTDRMLAMGLMCATFQAPPAAPIGKRPVKQTGRPKTTVPATSATFTGNWSVTTEDTAYTMAMTQTGNTVTGSYRGNDGSQGSFTGTVQGNVLRFVWTQTDGYTGSGKFTLADHHNSFEGSYNFGSNPDTVEGSWNGSRN